MSLFHTLLLGLGTLSLLLLIGCSIHFICCWLLYKLGWSK